MVLTEAARLAVKGNQNLRNRLAYELKKSAITIDRWIRDNDIMLTTASALKIIKEETNLQDADILQAEVVKE